MPATPPDGPKKQSGAVLIVAALAAVVGVGGFLVLVLAALLWWQFQRAEDAATVSAGRLTVQNDGDALTVRCTGGGGDATLDLGSGATGAIDVPPRPATCVGATAAGEVFRWEALDPPAADERWTITVAAPTAAAPPPAPVAAPPAAPTDGDRLTVTSERDEPVSVTCHDGDRPEGRAELPPRGSTTLTVHAGARCDGVGPDGTTVWLWSYTTPPTDPAVGLTATIGGTAATALASSPPPPTAGMGTATPAGKASPSAAPKSAAPKSTAPKSAAPKSTAPAEAAPAEEPAPAPTPSTLVRIDVRKAGKLKGMTVTIDGSPVAAPGSKTVTTGIHTLKASKPDVIDLECRLIASGSDLVVTLDPDAPKCP